MTLDIKIPEGLSKWTDLVAPAGRHLLFSAAANAVQILVRDHLSGEAMKRHASAFRLGATPTGILQQAARKTTFNATSDYGEVIIPSPAVARALGDVTITPNAAHDLTIPINKLSYGRRAKELRALGWKFFTPPEGHDKEDILFGYRGKGKNREVVPLYLLKKQVEQKQDRSLLPSDAEIGTAAARAMVNEIKRVAENAA